MNNNKSNEKSEHNLDFDNSVAIMAIGEALDGKVKNPVCPNYCPEELKELIKEITAYFYSKGYHKGISEVSDFVFAKRNYESEVKAELWPDVWDRIRARKIRRPK